MAGRRRNVASGHSNFRGPKFGSGYNCLYGTTGGCAGIGSRSWNWVQKLVVLLGWLMNQLGSPPVLQMLRFCMTSRGKYHSRVLYRFEREGREWMVDVYGTALAHGGIRRMPTFSEFFSKRKTSRFEKPSDSKCKLNSRISKCGVPRNFFFKARLFLGTP